MIDQPRLEHRDERPYVAIRTNVAMMEIPAVLPPLIPEVYDWLGERHEEPAGPVFFRYLRMDANRLDVEVGVPVAAELSGDDRVRPGVFPAGRYAVALHRGPYDRIPASWQALENWKGKLGLVEAGQETREGNMWGTRAEHYLTDPAEVSDPEKWETELIVQVADGQGG